MKNDAYITDTKYLLDKLPKVHKDLFALINKNEYEELGQQLVREIASNQNSIEEFELKLQKLFARIKDPHTQVITDKIELPIIFEWVDGGYYPFVLPRAHEQFLCKKLSGINEMLVDQFMTDVDQYLVYDNEEARKGEIASALSNMLLIKQVSNKQADNVIYSFEGGATVELSCGRGDVDRSQTSVYSIPGNQFLSRKRNYFVENKSEALYLRYSRCEEDEEYTVSALSADIQSLLNLNPQKLIIDLRGNRGGDSSVITPVIDILSNYVASNKPTVYCLIDRKTYSSGVLNCYEFKKRCGAILVGQPTAQGINHYGDIMDFILPNSGVMIEYSTKYFDLIDDDSPTIEPDIYIEPTIDDYISGNDPVLNYCLNT